MLPSPNTKFLLRCGTWSSLYYVAINIIIPQFYEGYSMMTYTVSELSAINAPTRLLWILMVIPYPILFFAFGLGLLKAAGDNRMLRITGGLVVAYCIFNIYWPPMNMRGENVSITDTLHIAWAIITVSMMFVIMGLGAAALGHRFRVITMIFILLLAFFGYLTALESPNIPVDGPTPTIGLWERLNMGVFFIWVIVFAGAVEKKFLGPVFQPAVGSQQLKK